jgi:hypothetical protein
LRPATDRIFRSGRDLRGSLPGRGGKPPEASALLPRYDLNRREHDDEAGMMPIERLDPDGHRIEVYWEP